MSKRIEKIREKIKHLEMFGYTTEYIKDVKFFLAAYDKQVDEKNTHINKVVMLGKQLDAKANKIANLQAYNAKLREVLEPLKGIEFIESGEGYLIKKDGKEGFPMHLVVDFARRAAEAVKGDK